MNLFPVVIKTHIDKFTEWGDLAVPSSDVAVTEAGLGEIELARRVRHGGVVLDSGCNGIERR